MRRTTPPRKKSARATPKFTAQRIGCGSTFEHARAVDHISGQLLEEMPAAQSLFYRQLETWRTGFSDADFSVVDGLIFFQKPENACPIRICSSARFF